MQLKKTYSGDLIEDFAKAVQKKDFDHLTEILDRKGTYQIQDVDYKFVDATRHEFLIWLKLELENAAIEKIQYKRCTACIIGNPVVLFNEGSFAYIKDLPKDHDRAGLMLRVEGDKIVGIRFCGNFGRRVLK